MARPALLHELSGWGPRGVDMRELAAPHPTHRPLAGVETAGAPRVLVLVEAVAPPLPVVHLDRLAARLAALGHVQERQAVYSGPAATVGAASQR